MDQGQLSKYREALLGSNAVQTPGGASPIATPQTAGAIGNLQNMFRGTFQAQAASSALGAAGGAAGAQANQEEASARLRLEEEEEKARAIAKQRDDLLDPSKYRQEIDEQGGFRYYDPQGQEIDIKRYSGATGKHMTEILKKSQNPADRQFVRDYSQVEKLGEIMQTGDKKALEKLYKEQPDLKKQIHGKKYDEIVRDFRKYYPTYFNQDQDAGSSGASFGSKKPEDLGGGGDNLLKKLLGSLFGG